MWYFQKLHGMLDLKSRFQKHHGTVDLNMILFQNPHGTGDLEAPKKALVPRRPERIPEVSGGLRRTPEDSGGTGGLRRPKGKLRRPERRNRRPERRPRRPKIVKNNVFTRVLGAPGRLAPTPRGGNLAVLGARGETTEWGT